MSQPASAAACFHCQASIAQALVGRHQAVLLGEPKGFCCRACLQVAEAIIEGGLGQFYRHRAPLSAPAPLAAGLSSEEAAVFDSEAAQAGFVSTDEGGACVSLSLEGLHCAACGWLIEQRLAGLDGVMQAEVNLAARRLRLVWQRERLTLAQVLLALKGIGYAARPWRADEAAQARTDEARGALKRLGVAGILWFQTMMATMATWPEFSLGLTPALHEILRWVGVLLTTPILFYSCAPFFKGALRTLRAGRASMDLSVALAIGGAYAAGLYTALTGRGELYLDTVGMFAFFLLAGRYLEARVRARAARADERWDQSLPLTCLRLGNAGHYERILVTALRPGDRVRVPPGAALPADGVVLEGHTRLDEALLSGESRPCPRRPGDRVAAGTLNLDQSLELEVTAIGELCQMSSLGRLLDRAQAQKPSIAHLADRAAQVFLVIALGAALTMGLVWWWLDAARAPWVVLAMLVAICPCALSLATPTALTAALGALQRRGVLITRGHVLEGLNQIDTLIVDKTGTVTEGRPRLALTSALGSWSVEYCQTLACALEQDSGHVLSHAFAPTAVTAETVSHFPGRGLEGRVDGNRLRLGAPAWVCALATGPAPDPPDEEHQWLLLGDSDGPQAWFGLRDRLREDAPGLLALARHRRWRILMLSGDQSPAVQRLASDLGIDAEGGLLPEAKLARLRQLQNEGRRVLVLGDGSNDALMLAQADIGIAMGHGTELARTQADAVLLTNRLDSLGDVLSMARRCRQVVRQNLAWAALYNGLMLPFAALALVTPAWAALGMCASSLLVVLNACRLDAFNRPAP